MMVVMVVVVLGRGGLFYTPKMTQRNLPGSGLEHSFVMRLLKTILRSVKERKISQNLQTLNLNLIKRLCLATRI
jgi:hypothetical protein